LKVLLQGCNKDNGMEGNVYTVLSQQSSIVL
jgi:hypothetical protein